jgi:hypothetical protein
MIETGDPPTLAPEICVDLMSGSNDWARRGDLDGAVTPTALANTHERTPPHRRRTDGPQIRAVGPFLTRRNAGLASRRRTPLGEVGQQMPPENGPAVACTFPRPSVPTARANGNRRPQYS